MNTERGPSMLPVPGLLEAVLDSWERNNLILLHLLQSLPQDRLGTRATSGGPTVAQVLTHIHSVRLSLVAEDAPEAANEVPEVEWLDERDADQIARMLTESAGAVLTAVRGRLIAGTQMELHYDHPLLMIQHLIWHEGYHHGQIKLALQAAGTPLPDDVAGPVTWGVWMRRS